jgi:hypothetical protein
MFHAMKYFGALFHGVSQRAEMCVTDLKSFHAVEGSGRERPHIGGCASISSIR